MVELFVIWESSTRLDDALWWRPSWSGYTTDLSEAGRYTREEAELIESRRGTDRKVPLGVALSLVRQRVRAADVEAALHEAGVRA